MTTFGQREPERRPARIADHYDAELQRHDARLRAATAIGATDRVLDVGCGAGQTTRDAARAATAGHALGVDVSAPMVERARRRAAEDGVANVAFEEGDAQVHAFEPAAFDVIISRFGTMFFAEPVAAFTNLARAARPGGRLVMMVWQGEAENEWATAITRALTDGDQPARAPRAAALDPFSLADPAAVRAILGAAGFADVGFTNVREPVYYGPDVETALALVGDLTMTTDRLAAMSPAAAERARARLRDLLAAHQTVDGVWFDARAWIVTARRP